VNIKAWSIEIIWEDGTIERLDSVPHYVSREVNNHLDIIEEVKNLN
tara:strand:- start:3441 stop:3578 length:138 start_codon:yes stop_codon:yes gene_type:complete